MPKRRNSVRYEDIHTRGLAGHSWPVKSAVSMAGCLRLAARARALAILADARDVRLVELAPKPCPDLMLMALGSDGIWRAVLILESKIAGAYLAWDIYGQPWLRLPKGFRTAITFSAGWWGVVADPAEDNAGGVRPERFPQIDLYRAQLAAGVPDWWPDGVEFDSTVGWLLLLPTETAAAAAAEATLTGGEFGVLTSNDLQEILRAEATAAANELAALTASSTRFLHANGRRACSRVHGQGGWARIAARGLSPESLGLSLELERKLDEVGWRAALDTTEPHPLRLIRPGLTLTAGAEALDDGEFGAVVGVAGAGPLRQEVEANLADLGGQLLGPRIFAESAWRMDVPVDANACQTGGGCVHAYTRGLATFAANIAREFPTTHTSHFGSLLATGDLQRGRWPWSETIASQE